VRNLRLRGKVPGVQFDFKKLFYLSLHPLSNELTMNYGQRRLLQESSDDFLSKQLEYNGVKYDDSNQGVPSTNLVEPLKQCYRG
jgi:hypothetical protein